MNRKPNILAAFLVLALALLLTAVGDGTAHIRATANDGSGVYGECTVYVIEP